MYKGDSIGIFCVKCEMVVEVFDLLKNSEFEKYLVGFVDGFGGERVIYVMIIYFFKGLEFRVVYMFGVEEMR